MDRRHRTGERAERAAEWFLVRHGVSVDGRNVRVGRGEVDLVGRHRGRRVVFEVRSSVGELRMDDRFDRTKIETVRRLAVRLGIDRVDGVGVGVGADGLRFHWSQNLTFD